MSWALVIHENPDMLAMISGTVAALHGAAVERVCNLEQARTRLMLGGFRDCSLIVANASAPRNDEQSQPLDRMGPEVALFLAEFRKLNETAPCVVLPSNLDGGREELDKIANVTLVAVDRLASALRDLVRAAEQPHAATPPAVVGPNAKLPRHADVDISLIGPVGRWTIQGAKGEKDMGIIDLNAQVMEQLRNDSERAGSANDKQLCQLGRQMYERLLTYPCQLETQLAHFTPPGVSVEGVRFRFEVDQDFCQLMVETMARPRGPLHGAGLDFYMLQSPIYRKFGSLETRYPLFKDKLSRSKPIDCLIIQGKAEKFIAADPVACEFAAIPNAAAEADMLEQFMRGRMADFKLGTLKVLRPSDAGPRGYAETVRECLSECDWHLVHYTGHSALGSDEAGYLVLGDGDGEIISVEDFAARAKQAQFVFLSSCRSADAAFVMKLVQREIPAVAGYAFPVKDKVAYEFAQDFYRNLFAGTMSTKFLEYAFMHARTYLHRKYPGKPLWTAPILFMQKVDGQRDEAHLDARGISP